VLTKALRLFLHPGSPAAVYRQPRALAYVNAARTLNAGMRRFAGSGEAHCIICGWSGRSFGFSAAVTHARLGKNEICLGCGSNPRTRVLIELLNEHSELNSRDLVIVDVGGAPCTRRFFARFPRVTHLLVDQYKAADVQSDATDIALEDGSADMVLCCHVIEHLEDSRKAISELFRILKPGGSGWIAVPQTPGLAESRRTGQRCLDGYGHVWEFGDDFADMLTRAGFEVRVHRPKVSGNDATLQYHFVTRRADSNQAH